MLKPSRIKFLDLRINDSTESNELKDVFSSHLESGIFLISDGGDDFEREFAKLIGRRFCVGFNTGTDALTIA